MPRSRGKFLFRRIIEGLTEPMMIILLVALGITVTVNIIKAVKGNRFDYIECVGIVAEIAHRDHQRDSRARGNVTSAVHHVFAFRQRHRAVFIRFVG